MKTFDWDGDDSPKKKSKKPVFLEPSMKTELADPHIKWEDWFWLGN